MQIVLVQLDIQWESPAENFDRIRGLLRTNPPEAESLVILPEMFATGFSKNTQVTVAAGIESERLMRELASTYRSAVLGGVVAQASPEAAANEAVAIAPDGTELVRYRKMRPFSGGGEDEVHVAGNRSMMFQWQGINIAPFICYDLRFPELFRLAVAGGAELFALMACWPSVRSEHWVRLLQARAIENLAIAVGVNRVGTEPGLEFDGRSCAFDEQGRFLFEASHEEQIKTIHVDVASVRQWRQQFPPLRDARLPGYKG